VPFLILDVTGGVSIAPETDGAVVTPLGTFPTPGAAVVALIERYGAGMSAAEFLAIDVALDAAEQRFRDAEVARRKAAAKALVDGATAGDVRVVVVTDDDETDPDDTAVFEEDWRHR
jgi:hypothetical protein